MNNIVVVTDFDGTLMQQDVGDTIMEHLGFDRTPELMEVSRRFHAGELGSKEWVLTGYGMVRGRQEEVDAVLEHINPREGAAEFLRFCRERQVPVTVLSDGMEYYIRQLMTRYELEADEVIVNPIRFEPDGTYTLGLQNRNPACSWCGCCKADVVRGMKERGARVVYIGDGISDTYGSVFADWIFARASLARYLEREGRPFYRFETFFDVLRELQPLLEGEQTGDIGLERSHPFCKFN